MEKLGEIISVRGTGIKNLKAHLIKREGNVAMYLRTDDIYETGIVKISKAEILFGASYPERETYWSNEDFGSYALATHKREAAEKHYHQFLGAQSHKA